MIPDYQTLMRPILTVLSDGKPRFTYEVAEAMEDWFELSGLERAEMLPSGKQRKIVNRTGWAQFYLKAAGLLSSPKRGQIVITGLGIQALDRHSEINNKVLDEYEAFRAFRSKGKAKTSSNADSGRPTIAPLHYDDTDTPLDLAEKAIAVNRAAVQVDVLQAALNLTPYAFEELVIRLLGAMGYGKSGMLERTSATGDAGVDGIISQDPLGLDRIYVQAKRYASDKPVDRPRIHEFAGALLGKQGDRGVFITTSKFTKGAREEAERINARIELIDGDRLAELLVKYRVGTQEELTVTLYRLDEDFFDTL